MEVKVAKTAGFCMGVKRAIESVIQASDELDYANIYTWGPLIHNPQTIELLKEKNIHPTLDLDQITDKDLVIIRSHGVSAGIRRQLQESKALLRDATCPKVARVQALAKKFNYEGYTIVLIGDAGHAEVEAIMGGIESGYILNSETEVAGLPELEKICVLGQTTLNRSDFEHLTEYIKKKFPYALVLDTLCDSTSSRQEEVKKLAPEVDMLIIVGGKNSANTKRLFEIAKGTGKPSYWVETAEELKNIDFANYRSVGVTAGASTPNWIMSKVVEKLEIINEPHLSFFKIPVVKFLGYFMLQSNLFKAGGVACLTFLSLVMINQRINASIVALSFFYALEMFILYNTYDWQGNALGDPHRLHFFKEFKVPLLITMVVSAILTILLASLNGLLILILVILAILGGIVLSSPRLTQRIFQLLAILPSEKITTSKDITTAVGYAYISVFIPIVWSRPRLEYWIIPLVFLGSISLIRAILFSFKDFDSDMILKRKSIPIIIGYFKTNIILGILFVLSILTIVLGVAFRFLEWSYLLLILLPVYYLLYAIYYNVIRITKTTYAELAIDSGLYLAAILGGVILLIK
ncbi:4-hydroxy-3-methylbut-2-enyl diphosphate reductase [bacterium]|nr:4-hydroxy-3-methylbut-2-enyl diphosphate reductase [bacterium]